MKPSDEDNPFTRRIAKKGIGRSGRAAEKKTAGRIGGRLTAASGAMDAQKGDMTVRDYLIENKSTVNESFSVKLEWLRKITKEAAPNGKTPALAIQFTHPDGTPQMSGRWVCVPEDVFRELLGDA